MVALGVGPGHDDLAVRSLGSTCITVGSILVVVGMALELISRRAEVPRRVDDPDLLGQLPDLNVDAKTIVREMDLG